MEDVSINLLYPLIILKKPRMKYFLVCKAFYNGKKSNLIFQNQVSLVILCHLFSKTSRMSSYMTLKIPIYDDYRMVLVYPSSPSPHPSAPLNLEVSFLIKVIHFPSFAIRVVVTLSWQQMRRNLYHILGTISWLLFFLVMIIC